MAPLHQQGRLLNFALYQIGWLACVLGAAGGLGNLGVGVALGLVALHVALSRAPRAELAIAAAAGAIGLAVDSLMAATGRLAFADASLPWLAPAWVIALWVQLATTLRGCLSWLAPRPGLAALLGAVGGPLAFAGGERLGAAVWGDPRAATAAALALAWAIALPLLFRIARRLGDGHPTGYRGLPTC
ncbi:MAG: DUF2878 family protein [Thermoanaerobaculia bacterium]|nr:DUF2878 family protein [Thermoanaerobaculia bacterium]